jgi:hypothetical protein
MKYRCSGRLWRKPIRTVLTVLSIAVAFLLFGILNGVIAGSDGRCRGGRNASA